jgi:hypothetical protein
MSRGTLTKNDVKCEIIKLMNKLHNEDNSYESKELAKKYLHLLLDKLEEYAR